MKASTLKNAFLSLVLASALPLAACNDDDDPETPTAPGPPVSEEPAPPAPDPTPDPAPPAPTPDPDDDDDNVTVSGTIANLSRSGADGLNVMFRINDFSIVHADGSTVVVDGSIQGDTSHLLEGQGVTAEGEQRDGFVFANRITITSK